MELNEFLVWVVSGGGAVGIASFVLERIPQFQDLTSGGRRAVFLGVAILLAFAAYGIVQYVPADVMAAIAPWFAIAAGIAAPILVGQGAHQLDPARKAGNLPPLVE